MKINLMIRNIIVVAIIFLSCNKSDFSRGIIKNDEQNTYKILLNGGIFEVYKKDSLYYLYDDVAFDKQTFDSLRNKFLKLNTSNRSAIIDDNIDGSIWPNGIVFYEFDTNYSNNEKNEIRAILQNMEALTPLKFIELKANVITKHLLVFSKHNKNNASSSTIGVGNSVQYIYLPFSGYSNGAVIHEICHAIGLYHEQNRYDRDNYIVVHYNNIIQNLLADWYSFGKASSPNNDYGSFDFNSIMLYPSDFGSKNNNPTMTRLDNGLPFYPQYSYLSDGDIAAINYLYRNVQNDNIYFVKLNTVDSFDIISSYEEKAFTDVYIAFYHDQFCINQATLDTSLSVKVKINYVEDNKTYISHQFFTIPYGAHSVKLFSQIESYTLYNYDYQTVKNYYTSYFLSESPNNVFYVF